MIISEKTQQILRNFALVNPSILLNSGSRLSSMSIMRNVLVSADVDEVFPNKIGIYDLPRFLSNLQIYPNLEFMENCIMMSNDDRTYEFRSSDETVIVHPKKTFKMGGSDHNPDNSKDFPEIDFSVVLSDDCLQRIKKVSYINSLPDYALMTDSGIIYFVAIDKKSDLSDIAREPVGKSDDDFKIYFKSENLKLYDGAYEIDVSGGKLATFKHQSESIQYWVSLESDSYYKSV